MNERQGETNGDRREPHGRPSFRRAENDEQKEGGQHCLDEKAGLPCVSGRRVILVAVRGKAIGQRKIDIALHDLQKHKGGQCRAEQLRQPIKSEFSPWEAPRDREAERDGRIEVPPGDRPKSVGAGQNREAECEGDTHKSDAELRKSGRYQRAPDTAENQPERSEKFPQAACGQRDLGYDTTWSFSGFICVGARVAENTQPANNVAARLMYLFGW